MCFLHLRTVKMDSRWKTVKRETADIFPIKHNHYVQDNAVSSM